MTNISRYILKNEVAKDITVAFIGALSHLDKKTAPKFFNRFFSDAERAMFSKRFAALYLLKEGWSSYRIAALLHMSAAGVRRIRDQFSDTEKATLLKQFGRTRQGSTLLRELRVLLLEGFSMDPK